MKYKHNHLKLQHVFAFAFCDFCVNKNGIEQWNRQIVNFIKCSQTVDKYIMDASTRLHILLFLPKILIAAKYAKCTHVLGFNFSSFLQSSQKNCRQIQYVSGGNTPCMILFYIKLDIVYNIYLPKSKYHFGRIMLPECYNWQDTHCMYIIL